MDTSKKMLLSVHKEMRAKDLKGIFNLPNYDDNQLVKITIEPSEDEGLTREERIQILKEIKDIMSEAKKNSEFDSEKTLEEYRMERLEEKYAAFN